MEIVGHPTIHLTMNLYGHVLPDRLRAAASAMDRAIETRCPRGYIFGYGGRQLDCVSSARVPSPQVSDGGDEGT
jgi:hypothetical protein